MKLSIRFLLISSILVSGVVWASGSATKPKATVQKAPPQSVQIPVEKPVVELESTTNDALREVKPAGATVEAKSTKPQTASKDVQGRVTGSGSAVSSSTPALQSKSTSAASTSSQSSRPDSSPSPAIKESQGRSTAVTPTTDTKLTPAIEDKRANDAKLDALRQAERDTKTQAQIPGQKNTDAAAGTGLEGRGTIGRNEQQDVDELAREVMGLGGDGFGSASIDRSDGGGFDASRYGSGSAADAAGAPSDPGHSSGKGQFGQTAYSSNRNGDSAAYTASFRHASGRESHVSESWSTDKQGNVTHTVTHTVNDWQGNTQYVAESTEVTDSKGNVVSSNVSESGSRLGDDDQADLNEAAGEIAASLGRAGQGAPNDNETGNGGPCNPVTGFGCEQRKSSHMDKISQPAHGNEIKTAAGTGGRPNAGPSSVTNPGTHDGSSGSGGSSSGGKPGEPATDPEEIIPPAGTGPSQ